MHTELSSFLTQVWENREHILVFGAHPPPTLAAVCDGVYGMYAQNFQVAEALAAATYEQSLRDIRKPPRSGWTGGQTRGGFFVWDNMTAADRSVSFRVYANAAPAHAADVFQRVLDCSCVEREPPTRPNAPGTSMAPSLGTSADLTTGYLARIRRRLYGDVIVGAKVAHADEAYSGRADTIVIYLNDAAGADTPSLLAQYMATWGPFFRHDHPAMTQRIASGLSIGPEVTMAQRRIGNSFGELRSGLIARALIEAVTGRVPNEVGSPIPAPRPGVAKSPNRQDFNRCVTRLFGEHGINVEAPWE